MIPEYLIAEEHRKNPSLTRLQAYRNARALMEIKRMRRVNRHVLDVTDAEQFPNIAEAVAHARGLREMK